VVEVQEGRGIFGSWAKGDGGIPPENIRTHVLAGLDGRGKVDKRKNKSIFKKAVSRSKGSLLKKSLTRVKKGEC